MSDILLLQTQSGYEPYQVATPDIAFITIY